MKKPKQWNNDIYANIVMKKKPKQKMTKETQKHVIENGAMIQMLTLTCKKKT
jgi:hypothetical protein